MKIEFSSNSNRSYDRIHHMAADMLGQDSPNSLNDDLVKYLDSIEALTNVADGSVRSRQVTAMALATWARLDEDNIYLENSMPEGSLSIEDHLKQARTHLQTASIKATRKQTPGIADAAQKAMGSVDEVFEQLALYEEYRRKSF